VTLIQTLQRKLQCRANQGKGILHVIVIRININQKEEKQAFKAQGPSGSEANKVFKAASLFCDENRSYWASWKHDIDFYLVIYYFVLLFLTDGNLGGCSC
jgi:hypothetical protein